MFHIFLFKGTIIGFSISAFIGPIGMLCIRRSTTYGFFAGIATGLGASIADAIYSGIAAFGLTFISNFLLQHASLFRFCGGVYLIYLGFKIFSSIPEKIQDKTPSPNFLKTVITTCFLTLSNPMTIIAFTGLFTYFNIVFSASDEIYLIQKIPFHISIALVAGVFIGSMIWWTFLTTISALLGYKLDTKTLIYINKIAGSIIILFGTINILTLLFI